jgi:hypothetical protein
MRNNLLTLGILLTSLIGIAGCASETEEVADSTSGDLKAGVNSGGCKRSAYNCSLNPGAGDQRVKAPDGSDSWHVSEAWLKARGLAAVPVGDGNGKPIGFSTQRTFTLNHGQVRHFGGESWVMALSSGLGSAGWIPLGMFEDAPELAKRVGDATAHGSGLGKMACYEIATGYDHALDKYKVVNGATDKDSDEPNDYLPQLRSGSKKVLMNLAFSAPGDGLGAPAVDIFAPGTKFQRLDVPTWDTGKPHLDVKLYEKPAGSAKYTKDSGKRMTFLYGYVKTASGQLRYGWMPIEGLKVSSGCPDR